MVMVLILVPEVLGVLEEHQDLNQEMEALLVPLEVMEEMVILPHKAGRLELLHLCRLLLGQEVEAELLEPQLGPTEDFLLLVLCLEDLVEQQEREEPMQAEEVVEELAAGAALAVMEELVQLQPQLTQEAMA